MGKAGNGLKYVFTDEDKAKEINVIFIEDDNVLLKGDFITKEHDGFIINGTATIDDEVYHDFEIFFALVEDLPLDDIEAVMKADWDWYDYVC